MRGAAGSGGLGGSECTKNTTTTTKEHEIETAIASGNRWRLRELALTDGGLCSGECAVLRSVSLRRRI
jgi:hypothetical protein